MFITLQERTRRSLSPRRASLLCLHRGCMKRERYNAFVFLSKSASIMIQTAILADQFWSNSSTDSRQCFVMSFYICCTNQNFTENDVIMHCQEMILGKNLS